MMVPTKTTGSEQNSSWETLEGIQDREEQTGRISIGVSWKSRKDQEDLIHKAKLKKQRAKELAKAGYNPATDPAPESSTTRTTADESREDVDLDRTDNRRNGRPQSEPRRHSHSGKEHQSSSMYPPTATSTTNNPPSKRTRKIIREDLPIRAQQLMKTMTNHHHHQTPRSKVQHANGQPKLSHRVSKILSKLQDEKEDQSHP
ncbi:hypothetical protein H4Q26_006559 [Puccinia striiformis f. sp. tritici PST-130]|nr:hypothetical protein H4Q26_006559 [Puccinia striiformis f. sp. tritici PST-130]